jgi:hypothetical protein
MATADDNSSKWQQRRKMMARKTGQRTMRGKEESRQQTTTAVEPTGQRVWKNKEMEFMQKDFFQQYGLSGWIFCSCQNTQGYTKNYFPPDQKLFPAGTKKLTQKHNWKKVPPAHARTASVRGTTSQQTSTAFLEEKITSSFFPRHHGTKYCTC